jgi:SsrA-binding protein
MADSKIHIRNKKASFEYAFIDKFVAGIQLTGTEIKSIRGTKASINEAYCFVKNNEVFIKNMHVAVYEDGSYNNHEPKRDRKLLLNAIEIKKIIKKLKDKGLTLIPLVLFINEKGLAKIEIAIAKGKKLHDKRESIKEADTKKILGRVMKR